jgi:hypothetical protein
MHHDLQVIDAELRLALAALGSGEAYPPPDSAPP